MCYFYNSEDESVTSWNHKGCIAPPNNNCIIIWHNRINHFNWTKHDIPSQQSTNKIPLPSIDNVTNIETKKYVHILTVSWNPTDHNTNPPSTFNTFKHKQSLLRGRFVKEQEIYPRIGSSKGTARSFSIDLFEKFDWLESRGVIILIKFITSLVI